METVYLVIAQEFITTRNCEEIGRGIFLWNNFHVSKSLGECYAHAEKLIRQHKAYGTEINNEDNINQPKKWQEDVIRIINHTQQMQNGQLSRLAIQIQIRYI